LRHSELGAFMFEQLFSHSSTVRLHREAPMAQEREAFLLYLHERGICRTSLRTFAALLNQIVRFLRLKTLRDVKDCEIESAARKWAKSRHPKRGRGPGPCTNLTSNGLPRDGCASTASGSPLRLLGNRLLVNCTTLNST